MQLEMFSFQVRDTLQELKDHWKVEWAALTIQKTYRNWKARNIN